MFFKVQRMKTDNILYFNYEPNKVLVKYGFGQKYFMTDFESFVTYNKDALFIEDNERVERLRKAKEAFDKIYSGEL